MQREKDYLKKKIDKAAKALAELLLKVTQTSTSFTKDEFEKEFEEALNQQNNLSMASLKELSKESFVDVLKKEHYVRKEKILPLADLIYHYVQNESLENLISEKDELDLYQKVILLYEYSIDEGIALSLEKYKFLDLLKEKVKVLKK